ncbi:MAG: BlaI/MecI/CopY family transcriptional regulator [Verrucomicrobiota bacterium]
MPGKSPTEPVSQTELQILDTLWKGAPRTIREICDAIYGDTSTSYYATVQSLLDRLEKKGWVSRDRSGFKHTFSPTKERSDFVGHQIQGVANAVCDGSIAALLGHLAKSDSLSNDEREELRQLIGKKKKS